jgi:hypothetical protein
LTGKSPAAESLRDDRVGAGAVESDQQSHGRRWAILGCGGGGMSQMFAINVAHPAQISLALLTDIGNKEQGRGGHNLNLMKSRGQRPKSSQSRAIVTDAGTK